MKRNPLNLAIATLVVSGLLVSQVAVGAPEKPSASDVPRAASVVAEGVASVATSMASSAPETEALPADADATKPTGLFGRIDAVLQSALNYVGVPYRRGGSSAETGFDCSGLVHHVFKRTLNVLLPRSSTEMAKSGVRIDREELAPGDLVFFNTRGFANSHVGIYLGDSKFVHAPQTGTRVRVEDMNSSYYRHRLTDARRVEASGSLQVGELRAAVARAEQASAAASRVEPAARHVKRPVPRAATASARAKQPKAKPRRS